MSSRATATWALFDVAMQTAGAVQTCRKGLGLVQFRVELANP